MLFQKNQIYILDGAMGTELQRRGIPVTLPLWSAQALFDHPNTVKQIYTDHILAGADIITTNTFRSQRRTLAKVGRARETERINALAVSLALEARDETRADRPILIAAAMTTLEDCYRPDLVPDDATLQREHEEQAQILASQPIDFFLLETFHTIREALAASRAAANTRKPFAVSFVLNKDGSIMSGELLADAVAAIAPLGPQAYLVNCIPPPLATIGLQHLLNSTDRPVGVYANGNGHAADNGEWVLDGSDDIQEYAQYCNTWVSLGAAIIGGCCGTTPEYTRVYSAISNRAYR